MNRVMYALYDCVTLSVYAITIYVEILNDKIYENFENCVVFSKNKVLK